MGQADRSYFEREWENAFAHARVKPSSQVWEGIEQALDAPSAGRKRRLFMLQLTMAASVLFAMSIGAAGVYQLFYKDENAAGRLAQTESAADSSVENGQGQGKEYGSAKSKSEGSTEISGSETTQDQQVNDAFLTEKNTASAEKQGSSVIKDTGHIADNNGQENREILNAHGFKPESDPALLVSAPGMLAGIPSDLDYKGELSDRDLTGVANVVVSRSSKSPQQWASLGVSAGNYTAGSGSQNSFMLSQSFDNNLQVGRVSEETSGTMYQVDMNFGKQIAPRWVIQGGVGYMQRNSEGTSNLVSPRGNAVADFSSAESKLSSVVGEPYTLENTMEVVTIPLQLGYILLDKKVGIRLLTGIANELMVKYKVQDSEGDLSSQTFRPGDSDEYNAYGLSAMVSTEVSYDVAKRYQLAFYPQVRQSLKPLKESDTDPALSMELGFKVRYLIE